MSWTFNRLERCIRASCLRSLCEVRKRTNQRLATESVLAANSGQTDCKSDCNRLATRAFSCTRITGASIASVSGFQGAGPPARSAGRSSADTMWSNSTSRSRCSSPDRPTSAAPARRLPAGRLSSPRRGPPALNASCQRAPAPSSPGDRLDRPRWNWTQTYKRRLTK